MITLSKNDEKRTEDQVKLLIGTGLLLGALGITYAIGQVIGSNIQLIKQGLEQIIQSINVTKIIQYLFYEIIAWTSIILICIGIIRAGFKQQAIAILFFFALYFFLFTLL